MSPLIYSCTLDAWCRQPQSSPGANESRQDRGTMKVKPSSCLRLRCGAQPAAAGRTACRPHPGPAGPQPPDIGTKKDFKNPAPSVTCTIPSQGPLQNSKPGFRVVSSCHMSSCERVQPGFRHRILTGEVTRLETPTSSLFRGYTNVPNLGRAALADDSKRVCRCASPAQWRAFHLRPTGGQHSNAIYVSSSHHLRVVAGQLASRRQRRLVLEAQQLGGFAAVRGIAHRQQLPPAGGLVQGGPCFECATAKRLHT